MAVDLSQFANQYPPQVLQALQALFASKPSEEQRFLNDAQGDLKGYLESVVGWFSDNGSQVADKLDQFGGEVALLDALGYQVNPQAIPAGAPGSTQASLNTTGGGVPLEQGLLQTVAPRLIDDVNADAGRRTVADTLANNAIQGAGAATAIFQRSQGGSFDGRTYFAQNPDVAAAFESQRAANPAIDANQFAEQHYLQYGQREGRQPAYIQNAQLAQDFNNANTTVASNIASANQAAQTTLTALNQATTALQQNLSGDLAARAAALQQQIATLGQNLDQLDATQRKALADQITAMQADLEQAIGTQRQALNDQITALGTAATTEAAARRQALSAELAGLNAAQAPLSEARTQAAELQATAVNVGLERTRDQLTADAARAGYVGGSTAQDASLARATVDARQRSAEAIGAARTANATDTRDIGVRGASGERTIADALAAAQRDITGQGATGNAALTGALAQGRQTIGNFGSAGTAGITNNTATSRAGIGAMGANQTFQDQVFGADQQRSLADALARGTLGVTTNQAGQVQQAQNQGAAARATYYDADYNRSLNAALGLAAVPANLVSTLTGLDNYAGSGLNRTQNALSWWSTNPGAAPTPGYTPVTPSNTGNDISGLGNGIFRVGTSIGASNNWWQRPTATTPTTSPGGVNAGGSNLYTSPLT